MATNDNNEDIDEIIITPKNTFMDYVAQQMESIASTRLGQVIIIKTDRVLKILEDTAKWSLPQDDPDMRLERPLPWILFLMLIIWLRAFRVWLSLGAYMVRSQTVTPHNMVQFIQAKRRNLRALRLRSLKATESSNQSVPFLSKIKNLFSRVICKPGQGLEQPSNYVCVRAVKEEPHMSNQPSPRCHDDDNSELNLTVQEMLDKYANENSDSDSDYVPQEDEEDDNENSTTSSFNSSEEEAAEGSQEKLSETTLESEETANIENKLQENGESHPTQPKETHTSKDSQPSHENGTPQETSEHNKSSAAPTEAAPPQTLSTPIIKPQAHLAAAPEMQESPQKSTPGHEKEAADMKPSLADSFEGGSPQEFQSIFHPSPLAKGSTTEAETSKPKEAEQQESPNTETMTSGQRRNYPNNHHNNRINHYNYQNGKNRYNRNRR